MSETEYTNACEIYRLYCCVYGCGGSPQNPAMKDLTPEEIKQITGYDQKDTK